jgi:hypothetical protein
LHAMQALSHLSYTPAPFCNYKISLKLPSLEL